MIAAPRPREPKDTQQDHHGRDLESRLALLSHHRCVGVHDIILRAGRREEGRFGIHREEAERRLVGLCMGPGRWEARGLSLCG
jgi:hypothetical protein